MPRRRRPAPLPIRDGLNPSRVRVPGGPGAPAVTALELITAAIEGQHHRHADDDHAAIAARFADGLVAGASGRRLAPDDLLAPGADLWFYRRPAPETPVAGPMPILHRDDDIIVVDKPPFLATTPRGRHITETAVVALRRELGCPDLIPAHRLDRLTAGLLVFVARPDARGAYQRLFAEPGAVVKRYEAATRRPAPGALPPTPFTLTTRQDNTRGVLQARTIDGPPNATTIVDGIDPLGTDEALWRLRPITGRTHQLRLHLNDLGFPIINDPLYPDILPDADDDPSHPLRLLCREITFDDPLTGTRRTFRSERNPAGR